MNKKRISRVYVDLTAKERAGLVQLALVKREVVPPEVHSTMPASQRREFDRLMKLGSAQQRIIGPLASDLAHRVEAANLRYLLAYQLDIKADLLDAWIPPSTSTAEPSSVEISDDQLEEAIEIPDDREMAAQLVKIVEQDIPTIQQELLALDSEFQLVLAELGVSDHPEPMIAEMIEGAIKGAEFLRNAMNLIFSSELPEPGDLSTELVENIRAVI